MKLERTGIILYTINYEKCVDFYNDILELKILFKTESLTCFEFGSSYLMVEIDDEFDGVDSEKHRIKTCLRLNVSDVKKISDQLILKGVEVDYQVYSWGTVAKFFDPDGNLCALKDIDKFEKQIIDYNNK
jgi:lactoylglutathione lyase